MIYYCIESLVVVDCCPLLRLKLLVLFYYIIVRSTSLTPLTYVWLFSVEYNFCEFHDFDIELQKY